MSVFEPIRNEFPKRNDVVNVKCFEMFALMQAATLASVIIALAYPFAYSGPFWAVIPFVYLAASPVVVVFATLVFAYPVATAFWRAKTSTSLKTTRLFLIRLSALFAGERYLATLPSGCAFPGERFSPFAIASPITKGVRKSFHVASDSLNWLTAMLARPNNPTIATRLRTIMRRILATLNHSELIAATLTGNGYKSFHVLRTTIFGSPKPVTLTAAKVGWSDVTGLFVERLSTMITSDLHGYPVNKKSSRLGPSLVSRQHGSREDLRIIALVGQKSKTTALYCAA